VQYPVSVTVLGDNTVVAGNIFNTNNFVGSVSTWLRTGHFVGNFTPPDTQYIYFVGNTDNNTIFADGFNAASFVSTFWTMTCPLGACTGMTELGPAMSFPGGVIDTKSGDVMAADQTGNTGDTFEMPSLTPVTFNFNGSDVVTIDATETFLQNVYGADAGLNMIWCWQVKQSGHSTGTCPGTAGLSGGFPIGIAIDPGS